LFFGFRYRFRGPDLEREMINQAMEKASSAAEDIRRSVCEHDGGARGGENSAH
jgi:hypothetical protein